MERLYETDELNIGEDPYPDLAASQDKKKITYKYSKERMVKDIMRNKFSLLLVLVSTILLEVSIPLAILNVYAKNALYIFLFICGTIGIVMNAYCYVDYFKNRNIKNPLFLFNIADYILGCYLIHYNFTGYIFILILNHHKMYYVLSNYLM